VKRQEKPAKRRGQGQGDGRKRKTEGEDHRLRSSRRRGLSKITIPGEGKGIKNKRTGPREPRKRHSAEPPRRKRPPKDAMYERKEGPGGLVKGRAKIVKS